MSPSTLCSRVITFANDTTHRHCGIATCKDRLLEAPCLLADLAPPCFYIKSDMDIRVYIDGFKRTIDNALRGGSG